MEKRVQEETWIGSEEEIVRVSTDGMGGMVSE